MGDSGLTPSLDGASCKRHQAFFLLFQAAVGTILLLMTAWSLGRLPRGASSLLFFDTTTPEMALTLKMARSSWLGLFKLKRSPLLLAKCPVFPVKLAFI